MRLIILGGGISGLSLAWFLQEKFGNTAQVTILERNSRLGGWIKTLAHEHFLFEQGPRSIRPYGNGRATLNLIKSLGLIDKIILPAQSAHTRYIYKDAELIEIPNSIYKLLRKKSYWKYLFPLICEPFISLPSIEKEETIKEFFLRRFGSHITNHLVDPFVSGIFAGDIGSLSLKACFPHIYDWERKSGSVIKGAFSKDKKLQDHIEKAGLYSLQGGLQTLVNSLATHFQGKIHLSTPANSLSFNTKNIEVLTPQGRLEADFVFSTLPATALANLLKPHDSQLDYLLSSIPMASVAVINLGFRSKVLPKEGFGYLIPSCENEKVLGMVWDSSAFPDHNTSHEETRITVMIGGTHMANFSNYTNDCFIEIALEALKRHLGVMENPEVVSCFIAEGAIPQYQLGHQDKVKVIMQACADLSPYFTVLGNCFYGVSINDCIAKSQEVARSVH
jgi:oxygen-dependent protoporphyrinogen oxidase